MNIKRQIIDALKEIAKDRYIAVLLLLFLLLCGAIIIFLVFQIHSSELQIVVHYTGFGSTNFYRDKWYYLVSFIAFVSILATVHTAAAYKLLQRKGRDFTAAFIWFSGILAVITVAIFYQILKIASLS